MSVLAYLLLFPQAQIGQGPLAELTIPKLQQAQAQLAEIVKGLAKVDLLRLDGPWIEQEYRLAAKLLNHACELGLALLKAGVSSAAQLSVDVRQDLLKDLSPLLSQYRQQWLQRNRPGGLSDSVARLNVWREIYATTSN